MNDPAASVQSARFADLGLPGPLLAAVEALGYESPSPIQAATIPPLLEGRDLLGIAQTGTGKTAAFALPALACIEAAQRGVQVLVLTPTRELALQVAEAFQRYSAQLPSLRVLSLVGGQSYAPQLQALKRGAQVVVGTPGRVKDHLERGTLSLAALRLAVLDEADEMLRMGFAEEVELILARAPAERQVALFSATMPPAVKRIAQTHLKDPVEVAIAAKTRTAADVRQRYLGVAGPHKFEALVRLLEAEPFEAMIVFARTKAATTEIAEKLQARGYAAAALNGDMAQAERERTVERLKNGQVDVAVATDVAARGLDVERISHVLNYDIPTDTESYIHRIGRTGRAGRSGEAILFVAPRERHLLRLIERATRQPIAEMRLPSLAAVHAQRLARFQRRLGDALAGADLPPLRLLVESLAAEQGRSLLDLACGLLLLAQGERPLLEARETTAEAHPATPPPADAEPISTPAQAPEPPRRGRHQDRVDRGEGAAREAPADRAPAPAKPPRAPRPARADAGGPAPGTVRYRVAVGSAHGVKPGQIVGAIANEADLDSRYIGRIEIHETHSFVDLPEGMPRAVQKQLAKAWVCGRQLAIQPEAMPVASPRFTRPRSAGKPRSR